MKEMNEIEEIAPRLSKIKKEPPFGVPKNYFDDFSVRLHKKLDVENSVFPIQKNRVIRLLKPVIGLAASFILIVLLVYFPMKLFLPDYLAKNNDSSTNFELLNEEDKLLSMMEKMDESSFFSILEDFSSEDDLNDEELMNYISSNFSEYEIYLETDF